MEKIVLINHKGGVGKTTSAINIAAGLALKGKKTVAIDLDPQANLTESFGKFNLPDNIYQSFSKGEPLPVLELKKNLSLVPASLDLAGIELEISSRLAREKIFSDLLKPLENKYDVAVFDCPPSLGLITVNALVAADDVYIPMIAEYLAYRGIDSIVGIIEQIKEHFNAKLRIKGVFFTKFNDKIVLSSNIKENVESIFGDTLMKTVIRTNIALAECQAQGIDIFEYNSKSNGAIDYRDLVNEILKQ
ncbi:MAG: ParA family protein [Bacteroidota bacterium]|nr:ParA family protein [Bacteroidota bacterium]